MQWDRLCGVVVERECPGASSSLSSRDRHPDENMGSIEKVRGCAGQGCHGKHGRPVWGVGCSGGQTPERIMGN